MGNLPIVESSQDGVQGILGIGLNPFLVDLGHEQRMLASLRQFVFRDVVFRNLRGIDLFQPWLSALRISGNKLVARQILMAPTLGTMQAVRPRIAGSWKPNTENFQIEGALFSAVIGLRGMVSGPVMKSGKASEAAQSPKGVQNNLE
jgi:hypothetical protein